MVADIANLGSYVVDEMVFPITRLWLANGLLWIEAQRDDILHSLTIHEGTEFRIHAPDGSEILVGSYAGPTATARGDDKLDPAIFTITQPLDLTNGRYIGGPDGR
jgi:hypothetical protein